MLEWLSPARSSGSRALLVVAECEAIGDAIGVFSSNVAVPKLIIVAFDGVYLYKQATVHIRANTRALLLNITYSVIGSLGLS